ncbi:regulatory protein for cyclic-di-GMP, GGDEF domain protein [Psychromonas ingrahamii 37]|uniref:Regulatory protein for cyclic-di-GMP, GGDEF domain protein n=1 Tax=Psychromonas ingrahamii (strain DSM 17664 / CCUG 51855 / 37) TaxID=357804 RepID=A1SU66_PSYIN|nr:GGDEF domain-containing protein [Psychromonas ingrahamii]ABM03031.1 regulatory protein for cyclic-di-GMP, GGDEF domain protein [Psychromonas ingrahamii 37]
MKPQIKGYFKKQKSCHYLNFKQVKSHAKAATKKLRNRVKEISKRRLELVRQSDIVARLGGNEFVLVLNNSKIKDETLQVAERIISVINKPVELSGSTLQIGASVWILMFPDDGIKSMDLIEKAD